MSLFRTIEVPCPSCAVEVPFELNDSINADRRPELREEVLARTFQQQVCPSCGFGFRVDPEFSYIETGAGIWISVLPAARRREWATLEVEAKVSFDTTFGAAGFDDVSPRVVFGWEAFHEKLVIRGADLDDATIEIAKVLLLRESEDIPDPSESELRLLGTNGEELEFGWFTSEAETLVERVVVGAGILTEIQASAEPLEELRSDLTAGTFVDMQRVLLPSGP